MAGSRVFTLAPNPHWVIIDNFSKLPAGAAIYTYHTLSPSTFKPAYQDAAGTIPYGQPIVGYDNGTMRPIYWEFDPANPTDTYYIRVYDSSDPATQQFLWDFNGLSGSTGGGGGGTVVTANNIKNFLINGEFYRNIGDQTGSPPLSPSITIAPSNHVGYVDDPASTVNGPTGPDIIFAKNVTTSTDSLSFVDFSPLGIQSLTGDVTPPQYLKYACTVAGAGETYKYVQFPIAQNVQNLTSQTMTVGLWARCNSGNSTIILKWRQFYGSGGGASADDFTTIQTVNLTSDWVGYEFPSVTPSVSGKTIGTCGNSATFLQIWFPLNAATNIDIIKPSVYFGTAAPALDFETLDQVESIVCSPRTGDIRTSLNSFMPGWAIMNDGTIGNASSNATTRANLDTYPLFDLIWRTFSTNQTLAPMFTSGAVPIAYGSSSAADFVANRQISLTVAAGRVLAGVSGSHLIGTSTGSETVVLTSANLPATDGVHTLTGYFSSVLAGTGTLNFDTNATPPLNNVAVAPSGTPINIIQPTVYMNIFIKL